MNDNFEKLLETIGLNRNEAKLYLTSLKLGPASAIQLGQKLGVSRQMVYLLIPDLLEKGLMKQIEVGNKRMFQAMDPAILSDKAQEVTGKIKKAVPILKTLQATSGAMPLITVYENPISMREWYRRFMREAKKDEDYLIWSTGRSDYWLDLDPDFYKEYMDCSEKIGVKEKLILPDNEESRKHQVDVGRKNVEFKYIKDFDWNKDAEKWVWRDQVCYLTIRENATNMIVLESKALAEIEKFDFFKIWNGN